VPPLSGSTGNPVRVAAHWDIRCPSHFPPGSKAPLVILNRDIFFFTGALSKAIADSIPITMGEAVQLDYSEPGIRRRLHDHPYIVHNFADAISRLVREGSSAGAIEVTLDESHNHIHARLVTAMDLFLISHEEAHVILGHVSDQSVAFRLAGSQSKGTSARAMKLALPKGQILSLKPNSPANGPSTTLEAELRTRDQEFQADALGFKLLIWSEEEERDPVAEMVAAAAPHMVFRVLDAANAYGSEAGGWTFSDANHPSAADRIKALSPVFDEVAKASEPLREVDFRIRLTPPSRCCSPKPIHRFDRIWVCRRRNQSRRLQLLRKFHPACSNF